MKKRKPLKTSFVVTFSSTAAMLVAATGCDGLVSLVSTSNPPGLYCPTERPATGDACDSSQVPEECVYENQDECGNSITVTCESSQWATDFGGSSCNPPPVLECTPETPAQGDPCFGEGSCTYSDDCGSPITASCPMGTWDVQYEVICNPPAPCEAYDTKDGCGLGPSCRWLEPGCAEGAEVPLPQAGCYPEAPCVDDTECAGLTCQEVYAMPDCGLDTCACEGPTMVCL
jgi:hypothetical protein